MARITGKNGTGYAVATRTVVSVAAAMTDGGAHTVYTLVVSSAQKYWNPNLPPVITKQTGGVGLFVVQSPNLYTVDYVAGTVTFLSALGATDVVKINGIEYATLAEVGDLFAWSLDLKIGTVDVTAFKDTFAKKLSEIRGWTATISGYHVSSFWWDAYIDDTYPEFYVALYLDGDSATSERFVGAGFIDFGVGVAKDAAVTDKITVNGTDAIAHLTS